nr:hypothetical protein [Tanacetum cinerariifolium]
MAPLPPRAQRYTWLRYEDPQYTDKIIQDFEQRFGGIFTSQESRLHVLDFGVLTEDMDQSVTNRLRMDYTKDGGQLVFTSHAWRRMFEVCSLLIRELMLEFFSTCRFADTELGLDVAGTFCFQSGSVTNRLRMDYTKDGGQLVFTSHAWRRMFEIGFPSYTAIKDPLGRLCHCLIAFSISRRGQAPKKVTAIDLFYLGSMDQRVVNLPYLLAIYLFRHAKERKQGSRMSGGHFIGRLTEHFGLLTKDRLKGLTVIPDLTRIDKDELVRLRIYEWVAPVQPPLGPQAASLATRTMPQRIQRLEEDVYELRRSIVDLRRDFDSTFVGSSQMPYQRRTQRRTGEAGTSAAPRTDDQFDP